MNSKHAHPGKPRPQTSLGAVALTLLLAGNAGAQVPVDANGEPLADEYSPLDSGVQVENPTIDGQSLRTGAELEALIGPIALYPDDLLAIILPAATYPLEVVQAARFLESAKLDSSLKPDADWDDSIVALLNYPEVLTMMNDDIDWTWQLGEAVVDQQSEVVSAIESFRDRAYAAGNLKSDDYQTVSVDEGIIEIEPANDDVIYVPYYEPTQVVHYSAQPVYHYYPDAYPVYFSPYANNWRFGQRPFWGVTTAFSIGWASNRLHVLHPSFSGHPFYGHRYVGSYWRQPSISVFNNYYVGSRGLRPQNRRFVGDFWRPRQRVGPRPRYNRRVDQRVNRSVNQNRNRNSVARNLNRSNGLRDQRLRNRDTNVVGRREGAASNNGRRTADDSRANTNRGNRNSNNRNTLNRSNGNNNSIRFRERGNGSYTATREQRMQRSERSQDAVRNRANSNTTRANNQRNRADSTAQRRTNRFSASSATRRNATATGNQQRSNAARTQTRQRTTAARQSSRREAVTTRATQRQTAQRQRTQNTARARTSTRSAASNRQRAQRSANTSRSANQKAASRTSRNTAKSSRNSSASKSNRGSRSQRSNNRRSN